MKKENENSKIADLIVENRILRGKIAVLKEMLNWCMERIRQLR